MWGDIEEWFQTEDDRRFPVHFFEYSDKSSPVKPSAIAEVSVILVESEDLGALRERAQLTNVRTGVRYLIKEISNSGIGVFEITLERVYGDLNEAVSHGKF